MDEHEIIGEACKRLVAKGYKIVQRLNTNQHGIDIIASNAENSETFYIEAKGSTSSKEGTAKFGKRFSTSAIRKRVAEGVLTCMKLRAENGNVRTEHVVLAIPETRSFRHYVDPIEEQLKLLNIQVWFFGNNPSTP